MLRGDITKRKILSFGIFMFAALGVSILLGSLLSTSFSKSALAETVADDGGTHEVLETEDTRLLPSYWNLYAVPTDFFAAETDSGEDQPLKNAFDRNWNTFYRGKNAAKLSAITVHFNDTVKLTGIVFAVAQGGIQPNGYPSILTVYADGNKIAAFETDPTSNKMLFCFSNTVVCQDLKLEYTINHNFNWRPVASEILFLQPEIEGIKTGDELFADYAQTSLARGFDSQTAIDDLEQKVSDNINYETGFKPIIERAKKILQDQVSFDDKREFSTSTNAKNRIEQFGDIRKYCAETLKMWQMGTNRQVTGIYGVADEEITVYVEAKNPLDPLPTILYSQFNGHMYDQNYQNTWLSAGQTLSRGKNTFTIKPFNLQGLEIVNGGALYISNPFTKEDQGEVKIYIEGGNFFPVYKLDSDGKENVSEQEYLSHLKTFTENTETHVDITEMSGNHIIVTTSASRAQELYAANSEIEPKQNLLNWDEYLAKLLEFDGIQFEDDKQYYDEKNLHINVNIRQMQPLPDAGAYAAYEHIGIWDAGWVNNTIQMTATGWGFAHEIGHMLDLPERTVSECSNNMFSMYDITYITKTIRDPDYYADTLNSLKFKSEESVFNSAQRSNYLIWWYIENAFPGYWGKLDNIYRFENDVTGLTPTEKQVYFSSLATETDLSYYFDRWGYSLKGDEKTDPIFSLSSASQAFIDCMEQAKQQNRITNTNQAKIWYAKKGAVPTEQKQIYNADQTVELVDVKQTEGGYLLTLPKNEDAGHLGYEIYIQHNDAFKLLDFTYENEYLDKNTYSAPPTYAIVAVDTAFCTTKSPGIIEPESPSHAAKTSNNVGNTVAIVCGILGGLVIVALPVTIITVKKKNKKQH